ncbi:hypothetical protein KC344_g177 [Hortaea werneckii]|nr:hypothetical protein KC344_g177 [Hortaea werneckii]
MSSQRDLQTTSVLSVPFKRSTMAVEKGPKNVGRQYGSAQRKAVKLRQIDVLQSSTYVLFPVEILGDQL